MPDHEPCQRIRIRCDVERLVFADAHKWTAGHIANGIATGLTRRDTDTCEPPHERWRVFDMNEVQLEILPRRDVRDAIGILFREIGHALKLFRRHAPVGNLDPLHSRSVPNGIRPFRNLFLVRKGF